jgi:hypothetical protein
MTSGAQRKIIEKGTIFFGHRVEWRERAYDEYFQVINHFNLLDLSYKTLYYVNLKRNPVTGPVWPRGFQEV